LYGVFSLFISCESAKKRKKFNDTVDEPVADLTDGEAALLSELLLLLLCRVRVELPRE
jgi:hypothetical protein